MHIRVLILIGPLSGNGKISCWQAFSNARDTIQKAFCYLRQVPLESSVTDALEEYVCKLYQPDTDIDQLTELRWWMFWREKMNCKNYYHQELYFSKVSNMHIINASFGIMWLQSVCKTSRCKYKANHLNCTDLCYCGVEEDPCKKNASEQYAYDF